jgi:competence protein ComEC
VAGILLGDSLPDSSGLPYAVALLALSALLLVLFYPTVRYSRRWLFGAAVTLFCFAGGWAGMSWQRRATEFSFPGGENVYRVSLTAPPEAKERTFLCRATVASPAKRDVILYMERDSAAERLTAGCELLVSVRLAPPSNSHNFDEFDYARYLRLQGVSATGYVAAGRWTRLSASSVVSLRGVARDYRDKVVSLYRRLGFRDEALGVLSALTVGDKTELDESVRDSYSTAGVSHILALSGLHVGLLYALFLLLLRPLAERGVGGRCLRAFLLLVGLWAFAFFTGLSPSVVRSSCMFSLLALAEVSGRETTSLNTLAATAWLMLLVRPSWLFDVGFQLSFVAVASILWLYGPLYRRWPFKGKAGAYVGGLIGVSVAAQVGTAPLVAYYFSGFPTYFLLSNLVVIPLISLILYLSVVLLALTPWAWAQGALAGAVCWLIDLMNGFVRWVGHLPHASLDGLWIYPLEVAGIYAFLSFAYFYLRGRQGRHLCLALLTCWSLLAFHIVMYKVDEPRPSLTFYNVRDCPAIHCVGIGGNSRLVYADSLPDKRRLERAMSGYWRHHHLLPPAEGHERIFSFGKYRVAMVADGGWRDRTAPVPLPVDYLYVCRDCDERLDELARLFTPACLVLDGSLPEWRRRRLALECQRAGIPVVSLPDTGSVQFLL